MSTFFYNDLNSIFTEGMLLIHSSAYVVHIVSFKRIIATQLIDLIIIAVYKLG